MTKPRHRYAVVTAVTAALLAAAPAAAAPARPFDARATISACNGDSMTVAAQLAPSRDRASRRKRARVLRKIRRAQLKIRFEAVALHRDPVLSDEINLGRQTRGRRFEKFIGLPAGSYVGVVRYRWVRGKRTVYSGSARTTKGRAAGRRGKAFCSLDVGRPPEDTTPPFVLPIPYDNAWRKGPLDVAFIVFDDLSGVSGVFWSVDRGPFRVGRTLRITTEGSHELRYVARDVAGNQTRLFAITLRVDTAPPTEPTIVTPVGATTDTTPDITWDASTDTGSGVKAYWVLVRDSANAIVFATAVAPSGPLSATVADALAPGQYTAEVIAIDGAGKQPFTTTATSSFTVESPPPAA